MPLDALLQDELCLDQALPPLEDAGVYRKAAGAYYTPDAVTASLCRWVVRSDEDVLLDPACGDGRFIARHLNSVGVDQDPVAVREARQRAPHAHVYNADFFTWVATDDRRFDCVVGNPPFIRYQRFAGEARRRALSLCAERGVKLSGLTSAWAPFLVAAASCLKRGGRAAFVVPAEIGHAPYAAPVLEYFLDNFAVVQVIAIREKLFPELSEDCWLLYAEQFGDRADNIRFATLERFRATDAVISAELHVSRTEWRQVWNCRLRPLVMPSRGRELYQYLAAKPGSRRLGDLASVGIGYVSGGNEFFHLRPSKAIELQLPNYLLQPTVRNGRYLANSCVSSELVDAWRRADEPILLLRIPKELKQIPASVQHYLNSAVGEQVREGYKCRHRKPWYSVPDVHFPEFFLSYLSGRRTSLVRNEAGITCTNALHYVRLKEPRWGPLIAQAWGRPLTQLSCELEGHPLGGGVLKLEPREASAVLLPSSSSDSEIDESDVVHAITVLQSWRHYC
ncbi:MAG TPA: N-6 DNA methylase [Stellaceae bacterium]|nr:N-6 DNA methylase [Stellaceae bacterium]